MENANVGQSMSDPHIHHISTVCTVLTIFLNYMTKKWLATKLKTIWNIKDQMVKKFKDKGLNWKNRDKGPKALFDYYLSNKSFIYFLEDR